MGAIILTYQTLEDINGTGITGILQTASAAVPILPGLIIGAIWVVLAIASYFSTQRRYGRGDFPASMAVGGFVACVVAVLMSLIPNFISNVIIAPCIILEVIFVAWLFSSGRNE